MEIGRILLVNVGADDDVSSIANDGSFPALGVVSLATVLQDDHPEIKVMAIDGQVTPFHDVESFIGDFRPHLVGLSVLGTSYGNSLRLADIAKQAGAVTVFGNDHAAALGARIMRRRLCVDYLCTADIGEFSFSQLVSCLKQGGDVSRVPGIMSRAEDGTITHNSLPEISPALALKNPKYVLDAIPVPKRNLLPKENWDSYLETYLKRYGNLHVDDDVTGVTTINRARGCARAKRPCNFCGIANLTPRFSSPEVFWDDVKAGIEDVNASIFYESFDSFSSAPRWIESLVRTKPKGIGDPKFFVYTQAAETTPFVVNLYKELGVYRVNMGLEAGDTTMLRRLKGPRDSLERNKAACSLFKEAELPIYGSLVLGGQGETYETLRNTVDFAKWLIDEKMMAALEAQPLYPDFGALTGKWMTNPVAAYEAAARQNFDILDDRLLWEMPLKYLNTDEIDFDEISQDWNKIFCNVDWDDLISATAEITSYAQRHNAAAGSARISTAQLNKSPGLQ